MVRRFVLNSQSFYELPNYKSIYQVRNCGKGIGVSINIKNSINLKFRPDLSINSTDVEFPSVEILCGKKRNILINVLYTSPKGLAEAFETFLNDIFNETNKSNKMCYIAGDFNLAVLDYDKCKKIQNFLNLLYQNNMISMINKPTRVTRKQPQQ